MIGRTNTGGGGGVGGGAELVIVGGTTRPAKATHNTIWIDTDTEITSYVLSATDPENPVEGMAMVTIAESSNVKIVSPVGGDWITVYPISAKQYINGKWEDQTVKSYQNGEWVDWWNGELYINGNQYKSVTGGWKVVNGAGETATLAANCIAFAKTGDDDRSASAYTQNSIDVTKFSNLVVSGKIITASSTTSKDAIALGLTSTNTEAEPTSWLSTFKQILNTVGAFEYGLNIDSVNGSYYVALYAHASDVEIYTVQLK